MLVSTFELVFAPISPVGGAVARRILQAYFLTISNLESQSFTFQLQFTITRPTPADATRLLDTGLLLVDNGVQGATALPNSTNNVIALTAGTGANLGTYFSRNFAIPARTTALALLLPGNPGSPAFFTDPTLRAEVRGYVSLIVPALFQFSTFSFVAQSTTPVDVLLNPEIRGTFVPGAADSGVGFDFDNTDHTLAVATGQAQNAIPPEPGGPLVLQPFEPVRLERLMQVTDFSVLQADPELQQATLLALLAQLDTSTAALKQLDEVLQHTAIPLKITSNGHAKGNGGRARGRREERTESDAGTR